MQRCSETMVHLAPFPLPRGRRPPPPPRRALLHHPLPPLQQARRQHLLPQTPLVQRALPRMALLRCLLQTDMLEMAGMLPIMGG